MDRIIDATTRLLETNDYDQITIALIGREAKTGASSIYARFKDKRAILLATHQRLRERAVRRFEELCSPAKWNAVSVPEALDGIVTGMFAWYRENHNVMKAALLLNDRTLYGQIANSIHAGAVQLSHFIHDRVPGHDRRSAAKAADFIFRVMTATFQQVAIFDGQSPTADNLDDKELIEGIVKAALAQMTVHSVEVVDGT
ncbi:MAG: TetR/AcrR family transcriptional regulator [Novosphingobium sp.]